MAFSFAGEKRELVSKVAALLARRFGEKAILYDKYHEAEFALHRLGFELPALYHNDTDLIVVVFCPDYDKKEWCGLEWDAIFDLLKQGKGKMVMLCRFQRVLPTGLYSTAGFSEFDDKTPDQAAALVLQRLALSEGKDRDFYIAKPAINILDGAGASGGQAQFQRTRFQSFATLLRKFSAFSAFPKSELFEKGLTFFLPEEIDLMAEMEAVLSGEGSKRVGLLVGKPATGKTVIACSLAMKFERAGFQIFYLSLTPSHTFEEVWREIAVDDTRKTLFILDDCHLNAEIASEICRNYDRVAATSSCLLISRTVDAETRASPDYLALDYVAAFQAEEQCFDLDEAFESGVERKILGIVRRRKSWLEQNGRTNLEIGDERQLLANVHRNLFLVEALLAFWPDGRPLSGLSHPEVLRRVRERYFGQLSQPARAYLLQLAAIGQFETEGLVQPGAEQACEDLRRHGFCATDSATGLVELPHSEFALLLLEAHAATPEFASNHRNLKEFTLGQLEQYIAAFKLFPANLEELLLNLFEHKARYAYVPLLKSEPIQSRIFAFYRQCGSVDGLVNFLFKAKNYLTPAQLSHFVAELVLGNRQLTTMILRSEKPILSFVKLLKTVHRGHREDFGRLWNLFSPADRATLLRTSGFYVVCYSIHSLNEADRTAARTLLELLDVPELVKTGHAATLSEVLGGLKHLRRVDGRKAKVVLQQFAQIDEAGIRWQLGALGFEEVAEAMTDLNRIDTAANQTLFSRIPDEFWKSLLQRCSLKSLALGLSRIKDANPDGANRLIRLLDFEFLRGLTKTWRLSHLGNGLAELNKVNPRLADSLVRAIDASDVAEIADRAPLVHVGKALSELAKVNWKMAAAVLRRLDRNRLIAKTEGASIKTISKSLSELCGIDRHFTREIYESMDLQPLARAISIAPVEAVGRTLCELHGVDPRRTKALVQLVDLSDFGKRLLETPLVQIGHTLTELKRADLKQAQALYRLLPVELLAKKVRDESVGFQKLGTLISQFVEVDTAETKTRSLLQHLGADDLARRARHGRFEELSAGLHDIAKCNIATAKAILDSLDFRALEVSARVEQFEKLCPGLKRLAVIDATKADSLARRFAPKELAQSASHLRVDLLASCLSDLAEVNAACARMVLKALDLDTIARRLTALGRVQGKQAIARIENVDDEIAASLRRAQGKDFPREFRRFNPRYQDGRRKQ